MQADASVKFESDTNILILNLADSDICCILQGEIKRWITVPYVAENIR